MNTAQQINVGDTIKSFDFPSNDECFMIGKVIAVNEEIITCETIKIVFSNQEKAITEDTKEFRTLQMGLGMFDDMEGQRPRIQIIN